MTAHWGVDDPAAEEGNDSDKRRGVLPRVYGAHYADFAFLNLPIDKLDRLVLQKRLDQIGKQGAAVEIG
jgi:arsenate reductase